MAKVQDVIIEKFSATFPELENRIESIGSDDPLWEKMDQAIADVAKAFKERHADPGSTGQKNQNG